MSTSRRRVGPAAAAALLAIALLTPVAPAPVKAVSPGTPGPVVWAMYSGDDQMLWTVMPGGEPVPVPGTEGARAGRWSPDGRVIAYTIWAEGIFLINPDGSGKVPLFTPAPGETFGEPVWSPDGQRIAFGVNGASGDDFHIEIADSADGSREVVETELFYIWDWLEDGTFLGAAWRYAEPGSFERNEELAEMAPNGTMTFLTDTVDAEEGVPRLSPDGSRIAYLSFRWGAGHKAIYSLGVMQRNGSGRKILDLGDQVFWPAWSPSGTEILVGPVPTAIKADLSGRRPIVNGGGSGDGLDWAALPGTSPEQFEVAGIRAAAGRDPSARTSTSVVATTIWPARDGYRDTVRITQRMREPAKASMSIYGPTGRLVRRVGYHFDTGTVSYTWNGRWSSGKIVRAGRYRLVTTSQDLAGNVKRTTVYVTLYRGYR